jgi:hypothetical protein
LPIPPNPIQAKDHISPINSKTTPQIPKQNCCFTLVFPFSPLSLTTSPTPGTSGHHPLLHHQDIIVNKGEDRIGEIPIKEKEGD